jgi:MFS family permease
MPEDVIGDISSALFNSAFSLGAFIGPLIGGVLTDLLHFENASSLLGLILIGFGFLYAIFGGALTVKKLGHEDHR